MILIIYRQHKHWSFTCKLIKSIPVKTAQNDRDLKLDLPQARVAVGIWLIGRPIVYYKSWFVSCHWPASRFSRMFLHSKSQALDVESRSCSLIDRRSCSLLDFRLVVIVNGDTYQHRARVSSEGTVIRSLARPPGSLGLVPQLSSLQLIRGAASPCSKRTAKRVYILLGHEAKLDEAESTRMGLMLSEVFPRL